MMDPKKAVMSLDTNKREDKYETAASAAMFNESTTASTNKSSTGCVINELNNTKVPQLKRPQIP